MPYHRYLEAVGRLGRDAEMHATVAHDDVALEIVSGVALGKLAQRPHECERNEGQDGQSRLLRVPAIQV